MDNAETELTDLAGTLSSNLETIQVLSFQSINGGGFLKLEGCSDHLTVTIELDKPQ